MIFILIKWLWEEEKNETKVSAENEMRKRCATGKEVDQEWLSVTQHYSDLRPVTSSSRFTMASVEKQQAFSFSRSYYLISQTSCVLRGARLGGMKKEDTSGRKRQRLTPLNQLSSKYVIVRCVEPRGHLTLSRLPANRWGRNRTRYNTFIVIETTPFSRRDVLFRGLVFLAERDVL